MRVALDFIGRARRPWRIADTGDLIDNVREIVGISSGGRMTFLNEPWSRYTGASTVAGRGAAWRAFVHPDDLALLDDCTAQVMTGATPSSQAEVRLRRADGAFRWFAARIIMLPLDAGGGPRMMIALADIDEAGPASSNAATFARETAAHADIARALPNRAQLIEQLARAIGLAERAGTGVVVLYLDLDHFKSINDAYGRAAGDALLTQTGARITGVLRAGDTASRFGGDEFVMVCATSVGARHAVHIAERLQLSLSRPLAIGAQVVHAGASIGISLYPSDGDEPQQLICKARTAMLAAKESGRSTYRIFGERLHEATVSAIEFEADLREAVAANQFAVLYQPIVNITSGLVLGAEALVRWKHPRRGVLLPDDFIGFAERAGLIGRIGDIVLATACAQLNRFVLADDDAFAIAINVSAAQFLTDGFVETIAGTIERYGIPPRRIELEITESIMMGNGPRVIETVKQLKALGLRLSIDDFGTGYSSLSYLRDFPIDTLKIDRSFVSGVTTDRAHEAISGAIVTLAHSMNIYVIGEGVETPDQVAALRALGTDGLQGNYISEPLPASAFEAFVAGHHADAVPAPRRRHVIGSNGVSADAVVPHGRS